MFTKNDFRRDHYDAHDNQGQDTSNGTGYFPVVGSRDRCTRGGMKPSETEHTTYSDGLEQPASSDNHVYNWHSTI